MSGGKKVEEEVSKLVFYAQSTGMVILGRRKDEETTAKTTTKKNIYN